MTRFDRRSEGISCSGQGVQEIAIEIVETRFVEVQKATEPDIGKTREQGFSDITVMS
jgi:sensor c-di-GMP phosphodiesterase-like protein